MHCDSEFSFALYSHILFGFQGFSMSGRLTGWKIILRLTNTIQPVMISMCAFNRPCKLFCKPMPAPWCPPGHEFIDFLQGGKGLDNFFFFTLLPLSDMTKTIETLKGPRKV